MREYIYKISIITLFAFCLSLNILAQEQTIPRIELHSYAGKLLLHRDAMKDLGHSIYWGNELRISMQTTGNSYWQQAYKYPSYGIGLYSGHFNNPTIGNPFAIFGFMDFPFFRTKKLSLSTNWGLGLTFNINEYDSVNNPKNIAIGTDINVYIDFMLHCKYKLTNRWELGSGIKFQHFSNGAIKKPNLGLNMLSGTLSVYYYPFKNIEQFNTSTKPQKSKKYELTTLFAYGINGVEENDLLYKNATLSATISRKINFKRNVGIGLDVFYNEYIKTYLPNEQNITNNQLMSYAVIISSDMIANKFRLTTQIGTYVHRSTDYSVPVYERVAIRFYPIKNMFTNISIKAHGFKAQFIEWGIGVSI